MNRPLKFKVWNKKSNEWCGTIGLNETISHNELEYDTDDLVFVQYTGLNDKNDKEICEGDILEWKGEFIAEVFFEQENAAFVSKSKTDGKAFMSENYVLNFQIIGNIFEHKHLLEK